MADLSPEHLEPVSLNPTVLSQLNVFYKDVDKGIAAPSEFLIDLGHPPSVMEGRNWLDLIHPDDRPQAERKYREIETGAKDFVHFQYRIKDIAGMYHHVHNRCVVARRDSRGRPTEILGQDNDVTHLQTLKHERDRALVIAEERANEAELLREAAALITSNNTLESAVSSVLDHLARMIQCSHGHVITIEDGRLVRVGSLVTDLSEQDEADHWDHLSRFDESTLSQIIEQSMPNQWFSPRSGEVHLAIPMVKSGVCCGLLVLSTNHQSGFSGSAARIALALADYFSLAQANARSFAAMERMASTDQLSSVLTRRAFFERSSRALQQCKPGSHWALMILDLDYFKTVNDTFGHLVGDRVISELGQVLIAFAQGRGPSCLVGRYGGEEFVILMEVRSNEQNCPWAHNLRRSVEQLHWEDLPNLTVSTSIGVTLWSPQHDKGKRGDEVLELLLDQSDKALYTAKSHGRNSVVVYGTAMDDQQTLWRI